MSHCQHPHHEHPGPEFKQFWPRIVQLRHDAHGPGAGTSPER